jgi:cell shape-determining protein MreD
MAFGFNTLFIIVFLLFQTSIAPSFRIFYDFFNLMNFYVVYLAVYRPTQEIIIFVVLIGMLVDSVSGCPFGLYITIYIWVSIGIKWILRYLHKGNVFLIPIIIIGVILAENFIIIGMMAVIEKKIFLCPERFRVVIIQLFCGALIGPFLVYWIKVFHAKWNIWLFEKIFKYFG